MYILHQPAPGVEQGDRVGQIERQLAAHIIQRLVVTLIDLCQTGNTGGHFIGAFDKVRHRIFQPVGDPGSLRAGADQRHLPFEHIDKLRQLIEPGFAQKVAAAGDPAVPLATPDRPGGRLGVGAHGAKLDHEKELGMGGVAAPDPQLTKEHRTRAIEPDGQHDQRPQWQRQQQAKSGTEQIHAAFDHQGQSWNGVCHTAFSCDMKRMGARRQ